MKRRRNFQYDRLPSSQAQLSYRRIRNVIAKEGGFNSVTEMIATKAMERRRILSKAYGIKLEVERNKLSEEKKAENKKARGQKYRKMLKTKEKHWVRFNNSEAKGSLKKLSTEQLKINGILGLKTNVPLQDEREITDIERNTKVEQVPRIGQEREIEGTREYIPKERTKACLYFSDGN